MNKIEKLIAIALLKGMVHATVVPVVISYVINYFIKGNFGGASAFTYIVLVATLYLLSKNKDISRFAYFSTIILVYGGWIAYLLVSAMFAGLGGSY